MVSLKTLVNSWYSGGRWDRLEGSSSSGNAVAVVAVGVVLGSEGGWKWIHIGGEAACRVASSKAATPMSATWTGF